MGMTNKNNLRMCVVNIFMTQILMTLYFVHRKNGRHLVHVSKKTPGLQIDNARRFDLHPIRELTNNRECYFIFFPLCAMLMV